MDHASEAELALRYKQLYTEYRLAVAAAYFASAPSLFGHDLFDWHGPHGSRAGEQPPTATFLGITVEDPAAEYPPVFSWPVEQAAAEAPPLPHSPVPSQPLGQSEGPQSEESPPALAGGPAEEPAEAVVGRPPPGHPAEDGPVAW